jgi:hypothetical protein
MRELGGGPAEAQSSGAAAAFGVDFSANDSQYYFRMTKISYSSRIALSILPEVRLADGKRESQNGIASGFSGKPHSPAQTRLLGRKYDCRAFATPLPVATMGKVQG